MNSTEILNVTNETTPYEPPFDHTEITLTWIILMPLCVFGIIANFVTIVVIVTSVNLRASTFNYFIVSLCVSDLLSSLISPLHAYRRTWGFIDWQWSDFLCKMFWSIDLWTSFVTSSHVLTFASLRFISLQWPFRFNSISKKHAKVMIASIWIVAFCIGFVPFSIWFGATKRDRTSPLPNSKWPSCTLHIEWLQEFKLFTLICYTLLFFLPISLVILLSIGIAIKVKALRKNRTKLKGRGNDDTSAEKKRRNKENQILLQLALIIASFLLGYVPHSVFQFYTVRVPSLTHQHRVFDWWFGSFEYFALRFSECLNPIFYNIASRKMRQETKNLFKRCLMTSSARIESKTVESSSPNDLRL
ncbi:unnamed protein product [Clavelina lepadiformis]|uniref:G-protein coupled receptors family 1 profile domain-containing protein n=1 Tax=Clavelina lepadiformis TaxID=159417 RepID=A0ABP0F6L6_CLALP